MNTAGTKRAPLRIRIRNTIVRWLVGTDTVIMNVEIHGCIHPTGQHIFIDEVTLYNRAPAIGLAPASARWNDRAETIN